MLDIFPVKKKRVTDILFSSTSKLRKVHFGWCNLNYCITMILHGKREFNSSFYCIRLPSSQLPQVFYNLMIDFWHQLVYQLQVCLLLTSSYHEFQLCSHHSVPFAAFHPHHFAFASLVTEYPSSPHHRSSQKKYLHTSPVRNYRTILRDERFKY